jgi:hypothetical protein
MNELDRLAKEPNGVAASREGLLKRDKLWRGLTGDFVGRLQGKGVGTVALYHVTRAQEMKTRGLFRPQQVSTGGWVSSFALLGRGWFIQEAVFPGDNDPRGWLAMEDGLVVECSPRIVEAAPPDAPPDLEVPYVGLMGKNLHDATVRGGIDSSHGAHIAAAAVRFGVASAQ